MEERITVSGSCILFYATNCAHPYLFSFQSLASTCFDILASSSYSTTSPLFRGDTAGSQQRRCLIRRQAQPELVEVAEVALDSAAQLHEPPNSVGPSQEMDRGRVCWRSRSGCECLCRLGTTSLLPSPFVAINDK